MLNFTPPLPSVFLSYFSLQEKTEVRYLLSSLSLSGTVISVSDIYYYHCVCQIFTIISVSVRCSLLSVCKELTVISISLSLSLSFLLLTFVS